ncbi:uncharacterized protein LOC129916459 [Episyrphus balteatus]|uniref:uncharacterized protein LOC129916459 n=1 Tax=Episyrphus balteatus TaxID=286459 RepID=UPI002485D7DA|nr:uncharacterized protein LOC129916459 [Episyrphus balteatus]
MKNFLRIFSSLVFLGILSFVAGHNYECKEGFNLLCQSSRLINNLIDKLYAVKVPIVIYPGFEIVLANTNGSTNESINKTNYDGDESIVGRIRNYLKFHEINIKLNQIMDTTRFFDVFGNEGEQNEPIIAARKKDGKMQLVAISLMFAKLLAFLKIGSLGALAMKALGIASMALLFSVMLGLKSLHQSAEETSHHVQYISDGHHRRRKRYIDEYLLPTLPLAYQKLSKVQK